MLTAPFTARLGRALLARGRLRRGRPPPRRIPHRSYVHLRAEPRPRPAHPHDALGIDVARDCGLAWCGREAPFNGTPKHAELRARGRQQRAAGCWGGLQHVRRAQLLRQVACRNATTHLAHHPIVIISMHQFVNPSATPHCVASPCPPSLEPSPHRQSHRLHLEGSRDVVLQGKQSIVAHKFDPCNASVRVVVAKSLGAPPGRMALASRGRIW